MKFFLFKDGVIFKNNKIKTNFKFPRLWTELFLVPLNIAWDYIVTSENHICPEDDKNTRNIKIMILVSGFWFPKNSLPVFQESWHPSHVATRGVQQSGHISNFKRRIRHSLKIKRLTSKFLFWGSSLLCSQHYQGLSCKQRKVKMLSI